MLVGSRRLSQRSYSYTSSSLVGAGVGAIAGSGAGYLRYRKDKTGRSRTKNILGGAVLGAGLGAAAGYGAKAAKVRYNNYINSGVSSQPEYEVNVSDFKKGDVVYASRKNGAFKHYGVVVDDKGTVVEFNSDNMDPRNADIVKSNLHKMSGGDKLYVEKVNAKYTPDEIAARALERVGTGKGKYSLSRNNCEHFARSVAEGDGYSRQVNDKLGIGGTAALGLVARRFSKVTTQHGSTLMKDQVKAMIGSGTMFGLRKNLSRDLGGLNTFDKYQTSILSAGGGVVGAGLGRYRARRRAKADAEKYGLKKGSYEYDNLIRSRTNEGTIKGGIAGGLTGFGLSKGLDAARGKVISDKMRAQGTDLGHNYMGIGKSLRGIHSEETANNIMANWKELGSYGSSLVKSI